MTDTRERARAVASERVYAVSKWRGMSAGFMQAQVDRLTDKIVAFAKSEAALARKQERRECAKAVCPACAMPERFDPPQGNTSLMTHRERGSGGIATCRASAIHERNLAETGG